MSTGRGARPAPGAPRRRRMPEGPTDLSTVFPPVNKGRCPRVSSLVSWLCPGTFRGHPRGRPFPSNMVTVELPLLLLKKKEEAETARTPRRRRRTRAGRASAGTAGTKDVRRVKLEWSKAGRAHEGPVRSRRIARRVRDGERGRPRAEPQADPPERQAGGRPRRGVDPDGHRPRGGHPPSRDRDEGRPARLGDPADGPGRLDPADQHRQGAGARGRGGPAGHPRPALG